MGPLAIAGIAAGGMGLLGALAGGQRQSQTQDTQRILAGAPSDYQQSIDATSAGLSQFQNLIGYGPGQQDVQASQTSSHDLASMLGSYAQGGFLPSQQDFGTANWLTQNMFAPQQVALQQSFQDQNKNYMRNAALMGRAPNDVVMQNELMKEQTRQQQAMQGQMTNYFSQQAMALPQQRLQYQQQLAQVNAGLASQALQNRQALFSLGNQLQSNSQNFMVGGSSTSETQSSGGGLMGALTSGLGMATAGMKFAGLFGGGSPSTPNAQAGMTGAQMQAGRTA